MIDTVVLTLQYEQFRIHNPEKFKPNALSILEMPRTRRRGERHSKAYCNPSKADHQQGVYKPRLTLNGRVDEADRYSITLRVECSFPKLLFGNNFAELTDANFLEVLDILSDRLAMQGIACAFSDLRYAEVSAIHYSKNMLLKDYLTCGSVLMALAKVNVNAWFDVSKTDYRNDGHLYKIHSNEFELVFYDKVKDLEQAKKSPKRALEKEIGIQTSLWNKTDFDSRKQVLRMEARLGTRRKIRDMLEKVGFPAMAEMKSALPLEKLFSEALAKKILLYYWEPFKKSLPGIITPLGKSPSDLYQQIAQARPTAKDAQILKWVSAYAIVQEVGWSGFKSLWTSSPRTFERLKKEIEALELISCVSISGFLQVQESLMSFKPLTMDALTV